MNMPRNARVATTTPQPLAEERRAAARYACDLESTCQPLSVVKTGSWSMRVLDLSATGIGIAMSRRFEVGAILTLNLETPDKTVSRTLYVRVVNVSATADGSWRMGCKLTGELGDDELRAFQTERVRPQEPDCRAWVRFACDVETPCHEVGQPVSEPLMIRIVDISPGGLRLLAHRQFDEGTLLNVELPGTETGKQVVVRVLHKKTLGSDLWLLGCEFAQVLSEDELHELK